jgi:peptidoglycan-N-acetylglucosamine deacetylase
MKNILLIQPNRLLRKIYPRAVWNLPRLEKVIYLTFDDGPVPGLTDWVLGELSKYNVKATFFCVGANILKHPDIFERLKNEGHVIANHTMYHSKGFKKSVGDYVNEVENCKKLTGNNLFRPPYGQLKRSQYKALMKRGYNIILWDVISYDFEKITGEQCANNVLNNTRNGSIVLFHDNIKAEKNIMHALPIFLSHFTKEGYEFKTLERAFLN